jgi:O-acetyl-ADP-ribose deacetylase (regulator of RNase III)
MIKYVNGDLIKLAKDGYFDLIAHGCNCFNTMNSGIAKQIREEWPQVYLRDAETIKGDKNKLGTYTGHFVYRPQNLTAFWVLNLYTQYTYGTNKVQVDYNAIRNCMVRIRQNFLCYRVGFPKIGCGLAGGDWSIIEKIMEEELFDMDVTIVEWSGK